jgi:hypothetical protein
MMLKIIAVIYNVASPIEKTIIRSKLLATSQLRTEKSLSLSFS